MNTTLNNAEIAALTDTFERYNGMSHDEAMRTAELNVQLKAALANGTATFVFRKADGTLRTATGTNKQTIVPNFYQFKGTNRAESPKVQKYYDLERGAFRCYTKAALVAIVAAA